LLSETGSDGFANNTLKGSPRPANIRGLQSAAHFALDLRNPKQIVLTARGEGKAGHGDATDPALSSRLAPMRIGRERRRPSAFPIVMVAVDTAHLDDPRQPAIRRATAHVVAGRRISRGSRSVTESSWCSVHVVRVRS
jgi:hypothetical protein